MHYRVILAVTLALIQGCFSSPNLAEYEESRAALLQKELELSLGWELDLTVEEEAFNQLLMAEKVKEMTESFQSARFPPSFSFLETWKDYENSTVFQMLLNIPKGGILHIHDISMTSIHWLISNATYRDNLYVKRDVEPVEFRFMAEADAQGWENVAALREEAGATKFDRWIKSKLQMGIDEERYETINEIWNKFTNALRAALGIITYKPVFTDYFKEALKEFAADGVQYVEFRTTLPPVYELDGSSYMPLEVALMYQDHSNQFLTDNPEFCGIKMIFAPVRHVNESTVENDLMIARMLQDEMPQFFAGFDLVAQEDVGFPLADFIEPLLETRQYIDYFFHAGETDWDWQTTDLNLVDALLLNTSRIGHGYAIDKHPALMEMARSKDIPIEVCPISNQVLGLLTDIRNHPAANLVKTSFPIVISSDDPPVWGALPLSHDFYAAFMAIGGNSADLRFIKQLILNSFHYSKMNAREKMECGVKFEKKWSKTLKRSISSLYPSIFVV
jgi:adenosine deaminase CECR1